MSLIHPTAVIDPRATIDPTVQIGPFCVIEGPVVIGPGTVLYDRVTIRGNTTLGASNVVHSGVIIGGPPQHLDFKGHPESVGVRIGDGNVFREYVTINSAYHEGQFTTVGNSNFLMAYTHIAHDCRVGSHVIMTNASGLAGHCTVEDRVVISGLVGVHQFVCIGQLAMISGLTRVVKDVPPFLVIEGNTEVAGINSVGMRRAGMGPETREKIRRAYKILFLQGLNVPNAVAQLEAELGDVPEVRTMLDFIRKSTRGITRHVRKSHE